MIHDAVETPLALGLGAVFLVSALPKLRNPRGFIVTVAQYEVLPLPGAYVVGWLLPLIEALIGLFLIAGMSVRCAALAAVAALAGFIGAMVVNLVRGREISCGCFSRTDEPISWRFVGRDVLLLAGACLLVGLSSTWLGSGSWSIFRLTGVSGKEVGIPTAGLVLAGVAIRAAVLLARGQQGRRWNRRRGRKQLLMR